MKILITGPSLADQGGVASYYNAVLPYLQARPDFDVKYMEIGGTKKVGGMLHPLGDQVRFQKELAHRQPVVFHVNPTLGIKSFIRDGLFIYQAKRRSCKVVVFFRGWYTEFEPEVESRWSWFFKRTYLKADVFIVLAATFKEKLIEWGVTAPILLGSTTVSSELLAGFSIDEKVARMRLEPVVKVLFLARLAEEKGVLETMQAVARVRAKGLPVELTVAGDGDCMRQVRSLAADLDVSGEFIFVVGDVRGEKKRSLLDSHHIYCFPTGYAEGMPNSVLEAMAFGMPVVTCPTGGLRDFFLDGMMGSLVPQRAVIEVADAIERLVNDRQLLERISSHNHSYASAHFLAPGAAEFLTGVYRQVSLVSSV